MIGTAVVLPGIFGYSSVIGFISGADPGANFVLSAIFGFLLMAPLGFIYIFIAGVLPRSGGDYVWISRTLNPILGFISGWGLWISIVAIVGLDGFLTGTLIIPITLVSFSSVFHNSSLLSAAATAGTPTGGFLIGLFMIAVSSLIILPGPKAFSRIQTVLFVVIMVGTLTSFGILLTSTHQQFVTSLTGFAGTNVTYDGVISKAQSMNWSFVPVALTPTLTSIPLAVLVYNGFNYSAAASGEIKNVKKSMLIGIFGSLVFSMVITVVGVTLTQNILSYKFIQASFFLSGNGNFPLPAPPWMPLFLTALNPNVAVVTLVQAAWVISIFWNTAAFLLVATRYVFAFSFDRVLPIKLSDVSARFHFPLKASALNFVITALFLGIASFTPWLGLYLNSVTIWSLLWIVVSVVAIRPALPQEGSSVVLAWRTLESAAAFDCRGGVPAVDDCQLLLVRDDPGYRSVDCTSRFDPVSDFHNRAHSLRCQQRISQVARRGFEGDLCGNPAGVTSPLEFAGDHLMNRKSTNGLARSVAVIVVVIILLIAGVGVYLATRPGVATTTSSSSSSQSATSPVSTSSVSSSSVQSASSSVASSLSSTTFSSLSSSSSSSSSSTAAAPSTLVIDDAAFPYYDLNEIESTSWPNWFMYDVYQPLILVNDTALYNTGVIESVPALAYNWTTPDNQTWTLNLLQNVTFSNGDQFNAYQAWFQLYSVYYLFGNSSSFLWGYPVWNMANVTFGPATISAINQSGLIHPSQQALSIMENQSWPIYVTGPYQIVFRMQAPFSYFPALLQPLGMDDMQWVNEHGGTGTATSPNPYLYTNSAPGTGPYMVTGVVVNSYVSFTQNPTYWGDRAQCGSNCSR